MTTLEGETSTPRTIFLLCVCDREKEREAKGERGTVENMGHF